MRRAPALLVCAMIAWCVVGGALVGGSLSSAPVAHAEPPPPPGAEHAGPRSYRLAFTGKAVDFNLSGMEPDFDPLYRVTVSGPLHDLRPASQALPNSTLVLSAYMEVFQPDTTPILPDLIQPDQTASDLAGFLSGKAALVNAGGHVAYRGSLLAEIFADNTEHLLVDLYPVGTGPDATAIRVQGVIDLEKGGGEHGTLRALRPLARAALSVPRGRQPSWRSVIAELGVRVPAMVGSAGSGQRSSTAPAPPPALQPAHRASGGIPPYVPRVAFGCAMVFMVAALVLALRRGPRSSRDASPAAGKHISG